LSQPVVRVLRILPVSLALALAAGAARAAVPTQFVIQGSLRDNMGKLQSMAVPASVSLFDATSAGNRVAGPYTFNMVPVQNGLFTLTIDDPAIASKIGGGKPLFVEMTISGDVYSRFSVASQLFAIKAAQADSADAVRSIPVSPTMPTEGQVLRYTGGQWTPATIASGGTGGSGGGPQGPPGPAGPMGPAGPAGPAGPRGPSGPGIGKATVAMANVPGPLPKSAAFQSSGGSLLLMVSGSAFRPQNMAGLMTVTVQLDAQNLGDVRAFTNEAYSHRPLVERSFFVSTAGPGTHTINLLAGADTLSDPNDYFNVTVIEFDPGGK
jgi:hypothetical protein